MDLGLIRALLEHTQKKHTGVVEVQGEGARTRLYFAGGNLVFADEGTVGETLGRILLRENVINEADYERVLDTAARAREAKKPARFGEIIVQLGILTQSQVDAALAAQVQHKVLKSIKWVDAKITFMKQEALSEDIARFPTEIEPLIIRSMRVMSEDEKHEFLAEKLHSKPKLGTDIGRVSHIFRLKTPETRFIELCDGKKSVSELLEAHVPDAVDAELLLCVLDLTGHVTFTSDPSSQREPSALQKKKKIDRAVPSQKRGRDRSALRSPVWRFNPHEKTRIKLVAQRLRVRHEEHLALVPAPQSRQAIITEQGARLVAEQHFRRGRQLLRLNKLTDALTALRRAVDLVPMAIEYRLYAAWANFRLLPEKENDRVAPLRLIASRAVKEDPEFGFGFYVLGHLAMREGKTDEGSKLLELARELDKEAIDQQQPLRIANRSQRITQRIPVPVLPQRVSTQAMPAMRSELPTPTTTTSTLVGGVRAPHEEPVVAAATTPAPAAVLKIEGDAFEDASADIDDDASFGAKKSASAKPVAAASSSAAEKAAREAETAPKSVRPPPQRSSDDPVASARKQNAPAATRSNRRMMIAFVVVLAALGAGSVVARDRIVASRAAEAASNTTTAETSTIPSQNVTAPSTTISAIVSSIPSAIPSASTSSSSIPSAVPSGSSASGPMFEIMSGTIVPPKWAEGRRVFVDGKSIGEGPGDLEAPCGTHVVQIGSGGKTKTVEIPCGGKLEL